MLCLSVVADNAEVNAKEERQKDNLNSRGSAFPLAFTLCIRFLLSFLHHLTQLGE